MLVLSRKKDERVVIGDGIEVMVLEIRGDRVKLGFKCPPEIPIHREEVLRRVERELTAQSMERTLAAPAG